MIDQIASNDSLSLSTNSKMFLKETAGWAKFLAIVGFVFLGLMVIAGLFAGSILGMAGAQAGMPIPGAAFSFIYIAMALLYFFPLYYLIQFSSKMKLALQHQDSELL